MKFIQIKSFIYIMLLITCMLIPHFSQAASQNSTEAANDVKSLTVHFEPNQMIQIIAPITSETKNTEVAANLRREYYQQAIPLAQQYGFKTHGQLNVTQTVVGDFKPTAYVLGSWPSVDRFEQFSSLPEWPEFKAMRVDAWDELKLFNAELEDAVNLTFREDKYYTVVFAWVNPEHPSDYLAYLAGIEKALNRVGGKFMLQLRQPTLETNSGSETPPNFITFAEWDTENGFATLSEQPDYQRYTDLRDAGIAQLEFHRLTPQIPSQS